MIYTFSLPAPWTLQLRQTHKQQHLWLSDSLVASSDRQSHAVFCHLRPFPLSSSDKAAVTQKVVYENIYSRRHTWYAAHTLSVTNRGFVLWYKDIYIYVCVCLYKESWKKSLIFLMFKQIVQINWFIDSFQFRVRTLCPLVTTDYAFSHLINLSHRSHKACLYITCGAYQVSVLCLINYEITIIHGASYTAALYASVGLY